MTPLRQRMIEDMSVRNLRPSTQRNYLFAITHFARHFGQSPADLGPEHIRAYLNHLAAQQISTGYFNVIVASLRFLYTVTLETEGGSEPQGTFSVDGASVPGAVHSFASAAFDRHEIAAAPGELLQPGVRRPFESWSDDVDAPRVRTIETTLGDLTDDAGENSTKLTFRIDDVGSDTAYTEFVKHELTRDYLRSLVRRGSSKVASYETVLTTDDYRLQVQPVAFTTKKADRSQEQAIRRVMIDFVEDAAEDRTFEELVDNAVQHARRGVIEITARREGSDAVIDIVDEGGESIAAHYPPDPIPDTGFSLDVPGELRGGSARAVAVTWEDDDFTPNAFFANLNGLGLGFVDAGVFLVPL